MLEYSTHSTHRFLNHEVNGAFTNEDGIDVFLTGARFQQALCGGELELPVESKEIIESTLLDKRRHPQVSQEFSTIDLL